MRRSVAVLCLVACVLATGALARAEEAPKTKKNPNPEYLNWAKFAVGAFVELTATSESMGQKSSTKMTHRLVELTSEKAVIETSMVIEGLPPEYAPKPQRREVAKTIEVPEAPAPDPEAPKPEVKEGEETIDVAGTPMKCKTFESKFEVSGMTTKSKTWTTDDVPGMTAKVVSKTEGKVGDQEVVSQASTLVTKWAAK